jgi:DNA invertase Pin-like site-specific DNA recombinase
MFHEAPVPAAQYVRMSTDDQEFSIQNQESAIALYAKQHGFEIVQTYEDAGKSGVVLGQRPGLLQLLNDVISHRAHYRAILVYDISRWGRFQDIDESAHYEFLCKRAGVHIHYCAEQFENNGGMAGGIMKALKRTMAGEFSRELGVKVYDGKRRLTLLGFRGGGQIPYGFRRLAISKEGKRRRLLKCGETKAVKTDRVILVPGSTREIRCVRKIFEMTIRERQTPSEIADRLNRQGFTNSRGRAWSYDNVYNILRNPEYAGCATWGRTTCRLHTPVRSLPRSSWIVQPGAYAPLVAPETFQRVQEIIYGRKTYPSKQSNEQMLDGLRCLLDQKKRLNGTIISDAPDLLKLGTYRQRFGSLINAYKRVGYRPPRTTCGAVVRTIRANRLREALFTRILSLFPNMRAIRIEGQKRKAIEVDEQLRISVHLCRPKWTEARELRWLVRVRPKERDYILLLCTLDRAYSKITDFYVRLPIENSVRLIKQFGKDDQWLAKATRLEELSELYGVAKKMQRTHTQC